MVHITPRLLQVQMVGGETLLDLSPADKAQIAKRKVNHSKKKTQNNSHICIKDRNFYISEGL